ncbi:BlaR1 family beta-lactam sensor/signal transducer [Mediterraneibacter massiliensis]|uniref:BlaR1 family beta-lactam sensor/signal transducer n=1 Tax=Mediterraneibacter massiliensis TaxID=1720300 RepID=UPI000E5562EC|nr:BlaR1 family beta-lactam sensor/signal transducer [Mediterraneibacter massiliensis]RGT72720.1 BlaR1 family beta-lactam sensor/signal transducer [Ruminococcus sp. AF18-22]
MIAAFTLSFLKSNLILAVLTLVLFFIKYLFKHRISTPIQYALWIPYLVLLIVPFLPTDIFTYTLKSFSSLLTSASFPVDPATPSATLLPEALQDLSLSVSRCPDSILSALFICWTAGVFLHSIFTLLTCLRFKKWRTDAIAVKDTFILHTYDSVKRELGIKRDIPLLALDFNGSPFTAGVCMQKIYLPSPLLSYIEKDSLKYIFMHELQHCLHKDGICNFLLLILKPLYWFNPFILYAAKRIQLDRELACDAFVLKHLKEAEYILYGKLLLQLSAASCSVPLAFSSAHTKKELKSRILHISSYAAPPWQKRLLGYMICLCTVLFCLSVSPCFSASAQLPSSVPLPQGDIHTLEMADAFGRYEGSFVLSDSTGKNWSIYNTEDALKRTSPDSTYKIYSALFALDSCVISPDSSIVPWDKTAYPFASWNRDQTLNSAMSASVNWYFQYLDKEIGKPALRSYFQKIQYGNQNISGAIEDYWLESSLQISPVEQTVLLRNLYYNTWNFHEKDIDTVLNSLHLSADEEYTVYGKTGTGKINGKEQNGWFIGILEKEGEPYFFSVHIEGKDDASGKTASEIAFSVLQKLSLL